MCCLSVVAAASHYTFHPRAFRSEIKIIKGNLAVTRQVKSLAGQLQTYIMLIRQYNQKLPQSCGSPLRLFTLQLANRGGGRGGRGRGATAFNIIEEGIVLPAFTLGTNPRQSWNRIIGTVSEDRSKKSILRGVYL